MVQSEILSAIVTIVYILVIIGIGVYIGRKWINTDSDFLVGGREMGATLVGSSLVANMFSGGYVPGIVALGFVSGFGGGWLFWGACLGFILGLVTVVPFWRKSGSYTPAEYFEYQYGSTGRIIVVLATLFVALFITGFQYVGVSSVVAGAFGIDPKVAIILLGGAIGIYAIISGMWGVSVTDFVQLIWVGSTIFLLVPGYLAMKHGFPSASSAAISAEMMTFPFGSGDLLGFTGGTLLTLIVVNCLLVLGGPYFWVRATSSRSVEKTKQGWLIGAVIGFLGGLMGVFLGLWGRMLVEPESPSQVLGLLLSQETPLWMGALAISGVIAATMSTIDLVYQTAATTVTRDIFQRYLNYSDRKQLLQISRTIMGAVALTSIIISILFTGTLVEFIVFAITMIVPFTVLVFDAWLTKFGTKEGVVAMFVFSLSMIFYWTFMSGSEVDVLWPALLTAVVTLYGVSAIVRFTGSWWTDPWGRELQPKIDNIKGEQTDYKGGLTASQMMILEMVNKEFHDLSDILDTCGPQFKDFDFGMDASAYLNEIDHLIAEGYLRRHSERMTDQLEVSLTSKGKEATPELSESEATLLEDENIPLAALKLLKVVAEYRSRHGESPTITEIQHLKETEGIDIESEIGSVVIFTKLVQEGLAKNTGVFRYRIIPTDEGHRLIETYEDVL